MFIGQVLQIDGQLFRVVQLRKLDGKSVPPDEPLQPYVTYDFSLEPVPTPDDI